MLRLAALAVLCAARVVAALPAEEMASLQQLLRGLTNPDLVRDAVRHAAEQQGSAAARCGADMRRWEEQHKAGARWALEMADSWAKSVNGLLYGVTTDLGSYDECIDINSSETEERDAIFPLYAVPELHISTRSQAANTWFGLLPLPVSLRLGLCVPDSCAVPLLQAGLQSLASNLTAGWASKGVSAAVLFPAPRQSAYSPRETRIGPEHWAVLCVVLIFVAIPIVATFVELRFKSKDSSEKDRARWRLLLHFSLRSGYLRLVAPDSASTIKCLNGIRVISALWIALGHLYGCDTHFAMANRRDVDKMLENVLYMIILNFNLAVDTFLAIGGMLCCLSVFRELRLCPRFDWISYAIHRILRVSPVVIVFCLLSFTWIDVLPIQPAGLTMNLECSCTPHWWIQLIYMSDYIIPDPFCLWLNHMWYLSADFKLYLLAPVLLLPLFWRPRYGGILLAVVTLAACLYPAVYSNIHGLRNQYDMALPPDEATLVLKTVYKPMHAHAAPYLVGIIFGWLLHLRREGSLTFKFPKTLSNITSVAIALILFGLVLSSFRIYDLKHSPYIPVESFFFHSFYRPAWSVGVLLLVVLCENHREGPLNLFLSWGGFTVLSRLTFIFYLFHPILEILLLISRRSPSVVSVLFFGTDLAGVFSLSALFSTILFLFVEQPFSLLASEARRRSKREVKQTAQRKQVEA